MWFATRNLNPFRRSRPAPAPDTSPVLPSPSPAAAVAADPAARCEPERRQSPRRWGDPMEVFLRDEAATAEPARGWIKNRSAGGLCISVVRPVPEGSVLEVRFTLAPPTIAWVRAQVRGCRPSAGRWMLHCQYVGTPCPEAVLLFR